MKPIEINLVECLIKRVADYSWLGRKQRRCCSAGKYQVGREEACFIVRFLTISPESLIKIVLRLYYFAPWGSKVFDPENHCHWFELRVIDELGRLGRIALCDINCTSKEQEGFKLLGLLYDEVYQRANFVDDQVEQSRTAALKKAIEML